MTKFNNNNNRIFKIKLNWIAKILLKKIKIGWMKVNVVIKLIKIKSLIFSRIIIVKYNNKMKNQINV